MTAGGNKQTTKGETLSVCDGNFTYTYSNAGGTKSVIKQAVQHQDAGTTKEYFDTMSKSYNLELQPDSKVGSRTAYVIKAMLKEPMPSDEDGSGMGIRQAIICRPLVVVQKLGKDNPVANLQ